MDRAMYLRSVLYQVERTAKLFIAEPTTAGGHDLRGWALSVVDAVDGLIEEVRRPAREAYSAAIEAARLRSGPRE